MAKSLDPESVRQVLASLRELDKELDETMAEASYRSLAQLQRELSLMPLYALLPTAEREPFLTGLEARYATSSIGDVMAALRILEPRTEKLPLDIGDLLYTMLNRVLHDLAFDPRNVALAGLGEVIHTVSAIGGPHLAARVTGQVLDAHDRWP